MYPGLLSSVASKAFDSTGVANSSGGFVKSFVTSAGSFGTTVTNIESDITSLFINTDALRPLLRNYPVTKLCLNQYVTSIMEIIGEAPIHVSIDGMPELTKKVNYFLDGLGIKDFLAKNLEDLCYYGSYASIIEGYSASPDSPVDYRLIAATEPREVVKVITSNRVDPVRYIYSSSDDDLQSVDFVKFTERCKVLSSQDVFYCCINPRTVRSVNITHKDDTDGIVTDINKELTPEESRAEFLKSVKVNIEYIKGKGIMDDVLSLLFEHMIKYIMSLLLSIKTCIRPDIMVARLDPKAYDIREAPTALQDLESMLNNGESTIDFRFAAPSAIIALIYQAILNQVKVVPGLSSYTDYDILEYPDITTKLQPLSEDLENLQLRITNALAIPEDLIMGGSSNRYEAIQRSSRFLSVLKDLFNDISVSIIDTAKWYIDSLNLDTPVSKADIKVNFNSYSILSTSDVISKSQPIYDKIRAISDILREAQNIKEEPLVDNVEFDKWLKDQLVAIDPTTKQFLLDKEPPQEDEEGESDSGGSRGGYGGYGGGRSFW